jgi:hypothetical protein
MTCFLPALLLMFQTHDFISVSILICRDRSFPCCIKLANKVFFKNLSKLKAIEIYTTCPAL